VEIKAVSMTTSNKEQRRLYDFSMRVTMKRPAPPAPVGAPPAAAAAGKSA
jgi:type IV pilus assembly protein PilN